MLRRSGKYLIAGLFVLLLLSAYRFRSNYKIRQQKQLIVYSVPGFSAYAVINGRDHLFYVDSALLYDEGKMNYSIRPHWLDCGLKEPEIVFLPPLKTPNIDLGILTPLRSHGSAIAIWQGRLPACMPPEQRLRTDLLILRGNIPFRRSDLLKWFDPGTIILDTSIPWWKANKIKSETQSVQFWDIREQGAREMSDI
jgi:hypothetical protein